MTITLSALAVTAASSLHGALLQFANELEAHKELIERLETKIQSLEALAMDRNVDERDTDIREMDERLSLFSSRLDDVECSLEDKLDSMDLDERVRETLQNVTFSVSVD